MGRNTSGGRGSAVWLVFFLTLVAVLTLGFSVLAIIHIKGNSDGADVVLQDVIFEDIIYGKGEDTADAVGDKESNSGSDGAGDVGGEFVPVDIASNTFVASPDADGEYSLLFTGDVSFAEGYTNMAVYNDSGRRIDAIFDTDVIDLMNNSSFLMVNNEFTFSDRGEPLEGKQFTFRAKPQSVSIYGDMGVDAVTLANNHCYDYGEVSLRDTCAVLNDAGIIYTGGGLDISDASHPITVVCGDRKVAIVSATQIERLDHPDTKGATESSPGTYRCWYDDTICRQVEELKSEYDYVIAYIHWGTESVTDIDWAQVDLAGKLASSGADLIIGDHPHILQRLDNVKGVPVIYSMGNYWFNSKTLDTCLLEVNLTEDGSQIRFIPAVQSGCKTILATGTERDRILQYMRSISVNVYIDQDGVVTLK
ncbi:MAG: CapA family protein [Lachnospiraceae bacterium]|nr:CapA family protein [Lachnospiraceae bacterium]